MSHQLTFDLRHKYHSLDSGITIDAALIHSNLRFETNARIDTGAQFCVFEREIGEYLGFSIESGLRRTMGTLAGSFIAFGHSVTLRTLSLEFDTFVYFYEDQGRTRNILGRQGWLQLVRLAIVDYDEEVYLSPYEEQI